MRRSGTVDPTPLSRAQLRALVGAAARELAWGLRAASRELRRWRRLAEAIPDARLREDALGALDGKRGHAYGAALFTVLPRRREPGLLRLLVAYETIVDFLDNVSERHPDPRAGERLHMAMVDALDPDRACDPDPYARHPWREDGGYLRTLVETCRAECRALPSFEQVRRPLERTARHGLVLAANHERDPARRDAALRAWADPQLVELRGLRWFELSGAASATLATLALLTLAAQPEVAPRAVDEVLAAYWPWISLATTMLDSYVDQHDDEASGHHSYIAHYGSVEAAVARMRGSIPRALAEARRLPDGERHAVVVACMVALYLSKASARAPQLRATTRGLVASGGSLVRVLLPLLRCWRVRYGQRRV